MKNDGKESLECSCAQWKRENDAANDKWVIAVDTPRDGRLSLQVHAASDAGAKRLHKTLDDRGRPLYRYNYRDPRRDRTPRRGQAFEHGPFRFSSHSITARAPKRKRCPDDEDVPCGRPRWTRAKLRVRGIKRPAAALLARAPEWKKNETRACERRPRGKNSAVGVTYVFRDVLAQQSGEFGHRVQDEGGPFAAHDDGPAAAVAAAASDAITAGAARAAAAVGRRRSWRAADGTARKTATRRPRREETTGRSRAIFSSRWTRRRDVITVITARRGRYRSSLLQSVAAVAASATTVVREIAAPSPRCATGCCCCCCPRGRDAVAAGDVFSDKRSDRRTYTTLPIEDAWVKLLQRRHWS